MNDFLIGLATTAAVIGFLEIFRSVDKKLIGALTLSGIAFIYVGFSIGDLTSLFVSVFGVSFFLALSYWGYRKNFILIVIGLVLHGLWDIIFPHYSSQAPEGYDIFCITIDMLFAPYFALKNYKNWSEFYKSFALKNQ